jgi:hypothetical protein
MRFSGPQNEGLALVGGSLSGYPDNGTGYLQVPGGSGLRFGFNTFPATLFSLVSFDVAEFSLAFPGPLILQVVGYKGMGLTVTNSFALDGIDDGTGPLQDFQTFYLDSSFLSLGRVDILCDHFSIDNIVIRNVPEPSPGALVFLGMLCGLGWRWVSVKSLSGR